MPLGITKKNGKFCVTDPDGKEFGCHDTKQGAVDQIGAIESSKKREKSGLEIICDEKIRVIASELNALHGANQPPVMIMSDGTPEGTILMLHGQIVPARYFSMQCSKSNDPYCDLTVTVEQSKEDGVVVEKTITLRKDLY